MVLLRSPIPPRGAASTKPVFELFDPSFLNGLARLNPSLTINSITVTPDFVYEGKNASAASWTASTYGNTLSATENGTDLTTDLDTPFMNTTDEAVKFNGGDYMQDAATSLGNMTTEDFVMEMVFRFSGATTEGLLSKKIAGGADGWDITSSSATALTLTLNESGGTDSASLASTALVANTWYHAIIFGDRSGSAIWYVNGAAGTAAAISSIGELSTAAKLTLGATRTDGTQPGNHYLAYCAMWKSDSWLDTHLQATVAVERFNRLIGIYPRKAKGTTAPTVQTRATIAHLDKQNDSTNVRTLFKVGSGWLRMCSQKQADDELFTGFLSEAANTNLCLQSEDFSTTWADVGTLDDISVNAIAAPDGNTTADGLIAGLLDEDHGVTQDVTLTSAAYHFSVWAKVGDKNHIYLSDNTVANAYAYFNLATGAVGTTGAGATARISAWGNGWYRCMIRYTGTVAAHTHQISPAEADNDNVFTGDGATVNTYVWGAQVELMGIGMSSSYIPTTTATATRNADVLYFKGDDGNLGGVGSGKLFTLAYDFMLPDYDDLASLTALALSDGGSGSEVIYCQIESTNDRCAMYTVVGGSSTSAGTGTTDFANGLKHSFRGLIRVGSTKFLVNGTAQGTAAAPADLPDDLDRIHIGSYATNAINFYGLVGNIRIFKKITSRG